MTGRRTPVHVEVYEDQGGQLESFIRAPRLPEIGPLELLSAKELAAALAGWARLLHDDQSEQVDSAEAERGSRNPDAELDPEPKAETALRVRCAASRAARVLELLDPTNSGKRPIEVATNV